MKIAIASAGRRAHYLQWFREAMHKQDIDGEVIALEFRPNSASFGLADRAVPMPAYNSVEYPGAVRAWCEKERPDLFISLNDYELQILSAGLADDLRQLGCIVPVLKESAQAVVADKYRMAEHLAHNGIPTPRTWLGSEAAEATSPTGNYAIKHRFGSGSTGLAFAEDENLLEAVVYSAESAVSPDGKPASHQLSQVVIQENLPGPEYGVDGVFSLDNESTLLGVLARRVETMHAGDPDLATSVSADRFYDHMADLGRLFRPLGSFNVDFREDAAGNPLIIDINPRLGGGYPFSHRAGADLPSVLVRQVAGLEHDPALLSYESGVRSARHEEFSIIS